MEIVRIFDGKDLFWCPCYAEDKGEDILTVLFTQWNDTQYLMDFFTNNITDLQTPYWQGISLDKAVNLVQEEVRHFEDKLICIEYNEPGCINVKVGDLFKPFKKHQYVINNFAEDSFVKGKLDSLPQMLRLYGIELEDGSIIISGGAIKICSGMGRPHLKREIDRLRNLFDYLTEDNITNIQGLN